LRDEFWAFKKMLCSKLAIEIIIAAIDIQILYLLIFPF